MDKILFKNKYRIQSIRWKDWDYSHGGYYFVTICEKNKELFFGNVIDGKMLLSSYGMIAVDCWKQIPQHFGNAILDEFIVMPNHIHGIITINNNDNNAVDHAMLADVCVPMGICNVPVQQQRRFGPLQKNSLSLLINHFKGAVTKNINKNFPGNNFVWQERFYDRVIRNERELHNVRNYILNNPIKWGMDRNNKSPNPLYQGG